MENRVMWKELAGDRWQMKKKKERQQEPPQEQSSPKIPEKFRVAISPEAEKGLSELPKNIQKAMRDKIEQLESYPEVSGIKRMWGEAFGKERMKFWDWRMEFSVDQNARTITIEKIGHRDTIYGEYH